MIRFGKRKRKPSASVAGRWRMTKSVLPRERDIHIGVARLLTLNAAPRCIWYHTPNERRTSPAEGAILKRMGVLAGVSDFTILIPRDGLPPSIAFLELKIPGGRLSDAQERFRDRVIDAGCLWAIAFSIERAAEILKGWGALRSPAAQLRAESAAGNKG